MNHTYRLVWNQESQRYVPAPECAKGKGKSSAKSKSKTKALAPAAVILGAVLSLPAWAAPPPAANQLPTGGKVVSGTASIGQSGSQMQIQQGSQKAIIDWTGFDIGSNASVTFQQNNASAIALNRVTAGDASQIHGQLNANGQVWLINPNGVVFGQGSRVDVGGLVASTMNITNADFENGNYTFTRGNATGGITNLGELTAKDGGTIALLAPTVSNDGIIRAQLGTVAMAAGDKITLKAGANGLLNVEIDPATIRTLIENKQLIVADGGQVVMTGRAADQLSGSVVANTGTIQANTLQEKDGKILLIADMQHGETQAAGTLQAKFIDTSAATVSIDKDLKVNTAGGEWLIDPVDITIDAGKAQAIQDALGSGNVTVSTSNGADNTNWNGGINDATGMDAGDIHVNANITYTANKLTLNADNNINLNAEIKVNGSGTLALNYGGTQGVTNATPATGSNINASFGANGGFKGKVTFEEAGDGLLTINGSGYTVIKDMTALQNMGVDSTSLSGKYALGDDIDASSVMVFMPIGDDSTKFTGVFDGLGHTITGLAINQNASNVGLFGSTNAATLRNVGLEGGSTEGQGSVGALVGSANGATKISNAYATGTVTGTAVRVGGLVGELAFGTGLISNAYATGAVTSSDTRLGGLVGENRGTISKAYATGAVSNTVNNPSESSYIGGLVGQNFRGKISDAYATGAVTGMSYVGGLVGHNSYSQSSITDAYATGAVTITMSSSPSNSGGLVGQSDGTITNAFYATTNAAGGSINNGGVGSSSTWKGNSLGTAKTFAELAKADTFSNWDTSNTWELIPGRGTQGEGYELGSLPTLQGVTRTQHVQNATLFNGGMGTEQSAYGVSSWGQLANMGHSSVVGGGHHFALGTDLDSTSAGYATLAGPAANGSLGWTPIGTENTPFVGTFDGQNHTISKLTINSSEGANVGMFGVANNATLRNVGLVDVDITGYTNVGALVAMQMANGNTASISNVYATGTVKGVGFVGGLVGRHEQSDGSTASISNAYASVTVSGMDQSMILGGLVGENNGSISYAYATGSVTGNNMAGGLVGTNSGSIDHAWASGVVSGTGSGALVSYNSSSGSISDSFWDAGSNAADMKGVDYDTSTNGVTNTASKTAAELKQLATFATDWDMADAGGTSKVWRIYEGHTNPLLRSFLTPVTVTGRAGDLDPKTYDGSTASSDALQPGTPGGSDINVQGAVLNGTLAYTTTGKDAGTYSTSNGTLTLGGMYSSGHDISFVHDNTAAATLVITPKALTITGMTAGNKTYDGSTSATLSGGSLSGVIDSEAVTFSGQTGTFADKNVGTGKAVTVSGITLGGTDAANYTVTQPTGLTADIAQKALTITANDASKTAGEALALNSNSGFTASGLVTGETVGSVQLSSSGAPANAAVGSYEIAASDAQGSNGFDANNYAISYQNGTLTVTANTVTPPVQPDASNRPVPVNSAMILLAMRQDTDAPNPNERGAMQWSLSGADGSPFAAAGGVPHLTLAPGFISLEGGEDE